MPLRTSVISTEALLRRFSTSIDVTTQQLAKWFTNLHSQLINFARRMPTPRRSHYFTPSSRNATKTSNTNLIRWPRLAENVTQRSGVRRSVCPVGILTMTHKRAVCDAASVHIGPTLKRTYILFTAGQPMSHTHVFTVTEFAALTSTTSQLFN